MSSVTPKQRLIRAVRMLPGTVRIADGRMEDASPGSVEVAVAEARPSAEKSALEIAEAEVRKLKSEIKRHEESLAAARQECASLNARIEAERKALEREREEFRVNAAKEADVAREAARIEGRRQGNTTGYTEGLAKAETDMRKEYETKFSQAVSLLSEMARSLSEARERLASAHSSQLIRLWEMMLRKMLVSAVEMDPDVVDRAVQSILRRISDRERIIIYLNSADVAMIEEGKEKLMDSIRGVKVFELLADDHVDKGSCLIETNLGIYDARWKTQLEQVASEVQNLLMENIVIDGTNS